MSVSPSTSDTEPRLNSTMSPRRSSAICSTRVETRFGRRRRRDVEHELGRRERPAGLRFLHVGHQSVDSGRRGPSAGVRHAGKRSSARLCAHCAGRLMTLVGSQPARGGLWTPRVEGGVTPRLYDHIIVGGGSAGSALANRLTTDPANRVLVLEAGRPDWAWDIFIHMPSALAFPIGSRFYDWKYESEPEPFMGGRRVYHARGKVLGGSSSINGMIFQRGNPLDYERWAADPGMETWDWAHCLPYFKRMETCLAAAPDDRYRGHDGPLIARARPGHEPALRRVLRGRPTGGLRAQRGRQRLPPGGFRAVRSQHPPGPAPERGAGVPAPGHGAQEPSRRDRCVRHQDPVPGKPRGRRRIHERRPARPGPGRRGDPRGRGDRIAAAPPAVRASAMPRSWGGTASTSSPTSRASASTCRTTSRSTSSIAAGSPSRWRPPSCGGTGRGSASSGSSFGAGRAPRTTSKAVASPAATTTSRTRT